MTDAPRFAPADLATDGEALFQLNVAYLQWIADEVAAHFGASLTDLLGMSVSAYVAEALPKLCAHAPPAAVFYCVRQGEAMVGMGGFRRAGAGMAELKRIYVAPQARGAGLGAQILERLIADARALGYSRMRLDSGGFMTTAHRTYTAFGFIDREPYPEAEVPSALHPHWRFMERAL